MKQLPHANVSPVSPLFLETSICRGMHLMMGIFNNELEDNRIYMAKPRVFISSTFYDLRQIRADIDQFLRGRV